MHINFSKIVLHNFMSFGHSELCFNDDGFIKVSGVNENPDDMATSNGSGKSSLWESIIWALTGDTIRGTKHVSNIYGDDGTYVQLQFSVDNQFYNIIRAKEHKQYKTNLIIEIDGKDCSGKGIRESEKLLSQYLPDINSSLLGSVIILGQGLPQRFTNNTPAGRKEVLETLSKSDFMIEDLRGRIDTRKQELNGRNRELESESIRLETRIEMLQKTIESNNTTLSTLNREAFETQLSQYESEKVRLESLSGAEDRLTSECEATIEGLTAQILEINQKISDEVAAVDNEYHSTADALKEQMSNITIEMNGVRAEISRIESIKDVCPTCGQHLPNVVKPSTDSLRERFNALTIQHAAIKEKISECDRTRFEKNQQIQYAYSTLKGQLTEQLNTATAQKKSHNLQYIRYNQELIAVNGNIASVKAKLEQIDTTRESLTKDNATLSCEVITNQEKILYNKSERITLGYHLDVISKFETAIKRDFRGYLLLSVIEYIERRAKEYSLKIFDTDKITFCLDGNNINISYLGKEYENLSGGEKQKIDLIIQFSIRDMLCSHIGFTSNILVLDEVFDGLDMIGCNRVVDMIAGLTDVKNVFIVTHRKDLSIPCDHEIEVVKSAYGISEIKK